MEWLAPKELRLADLPEPTAESGQLVLDVANCGICGSDLHSYTRGLGTRAGQVLGHEFCGTVASAPDVPDVKVGDRVVVCPIIPCGECHACAVGNARSCAVALAGTIGGGRPGAFAEQVLVPRAVVGETVFLLPPEVDDRAGALVEPLAVSLRAVRTAAPREDDVVLVLGAGTIGLGVVHFARQLLGSGSLIVADPSRLRRRAAERLGADLTIDPLSVDTVESLREVAAAAGAFGPEVGADCVIDCAGAKAGFADALAAVRHGGAVVLAAMYGQEIELLPNRIVEKELRLHGSFAYDDEFADVVAHLAAGNLDTEAMISHELPLAQGPEAFELQLEREGSLKVLVSPRL